MLAVLEPCIVLAPVPKLDKLPEVVREAQEQQVALLEVRVLDTQFTLLVAAQEVHTAVAAELLLAAIKILKLGLAALAQSVSYGPDVNDLFL